MVKQDYPEEEKRSFPLDFFIFLKGQEVAQLLFLANTAINFIVESDFLFIFYLTMNLRQELEARGLLYQMTNENFFDLYEKGGEKFYCGYDPTADSLHLGHFLTFMAAVNFMKRGNTFVMLIGGAT